MNEILREKSIYPTRKFQIIQGDITEEDVEAIVNAANSRLQHGGGLAGVISRKGGTRIQQESDDWVSKYGPVRHSRPAYTNSGNLPCTYIIHAVGPVWGSGEEDSKLADAVSGSLRTADSLGMRSIAIPAISTGIFGFPIDRAARIILNAILKYFSDNRNSSIDLVRLVLFDISSVNIFLNIWDEIDR